MAFIKGQKITAVDYNTIVSATNKVFADTSTVTVPSQTTAAQEELKFGWGQNAATTSTVGQKITSQLVNQLIDRLNISSTQVGSQYSLSRLSPTSSITATIFNDIQTVLTDCSGKKNNLAANQGAIILLGTKTNSSTWTKDQIATYTVNLRFASFAEARYFFNSGGNIKLSMQHSTSAIDNIFDVAYTRLGTITLSLTDCISSTTDVTSTHLGFVKLMSSDSLLIDSSITESTNGSIFGTDNAYGGSGGYGSAYGQYSGGYGGSSIKIYGKIITAATGQCDVTLSVKLDYDHASVFLGDHTLRVDMVKAIDKSSGDADFHIIPPTCTITFSI